MNGLVLTSNREITISAAGSRKAVSWPAQRLLISELYNRLQTPVRSAETYDEYMRLPKPQQDDLKDVGGFVGGTLKDNRRKAGNVISRDVIALDLDNIPAGGTDDVIQRVAGLGCGWSVYSTRKHCGAKPRLRCVIPLDESATPDEYEAISRKLAQIIGIELFDPTTFEPSRLMYWPSCCADSDYVFRYEDKPLLSKNGVLGMYADWQDMTQWPQVPGSEYTPRKLAAKQGDPTQKKGVVGAFCRTYDIYAAIEKYLPEIYEPVADDGNRFTYLGGSTVGGAVVYEGGRFLYSHHATDPCSQRLVNAFDLIRLHRFGDLDDEAKQDTPTNRLPSYTAMTELATSDPEVTRLLGRERMAQVQSDFGVFESMGGDENWSDRLDTAANSGMPVKSIRNVLTMLEYDPALAGRIKYNEFDEMITGIAPLPWQGRADGAGAFEWADSDDAGLRSYAEKILGFRTAAVISDAFMLHVAKHQFNPVADYLDGLVWDGVERLDTLLTDYLGVEDTVYTRAVMRKSLCAAVARAYCPGIKFDTALIITGAQGIGKSTFLARLGGERFTDGVKTFEGKDASEIIRGKWIVEIGELEAMNRSEKDRVKQFMSQRVDRYRVAYERRAKDFPRKCVFFGTTNGHDFLKDETGNRRFWPVDARIERATKSVFTDLTQTEIDQIWAEAVVRYRAGEKLYLEGMADAYAKEAQEGHRDISAREGLIFEFIEKQIPADWSRWNLDRRRLFWAGAITDCAELVQREKICAAEIWCECMGGDFKNMRRSDTAEINAIMSKAKGWIRSGKALRVGGDYGVQKGFVREKPEKESKTPEPEKQPKTPEQENEVTRNVTGS